MDRTFQFLCALITIAVYFVPWFIASYRNHPRKHAIALLNLLLGWTFLGWVLAIWWSCRQDGKNMWSSRVGGPENLGDRLGREP